mmetsp:Transcript_58702/g.127469  ORF Transcript_58702/g.127469 Transcript_58702/m.127469 type:complete len:207 (+) Transcript_58702:1541-2161(+)
MLLHVVDLIGVGRHQILVQVLRLAHVVDFALLLDYGVLHYQLLGFNLLEFNVHALLLLLLDVDALLKHAHFSFQSFQVVLQSLLNHFEPLGLQLALVQVLLVALCQLNLSQVFTVGALDFTLQGKYLHFLFLVEFLEFRQIFVAFLDVFKSVLPVFQDGAFGRFDAFFLIDGFLEDLASIAGFLLLRRKLRGENGLQFREFLDLFV